MCTVPVFSANCRLFAMHLLLRTLAYKLVVILMQSVMLRELLLMAVIDHLLPTIIIVRSLSLPVYSP